MKAIIMAAGRATRLLPLTKEIPQCLLKIGKKTILEIQIDNLRKVGIDDIIVITGYFSEKVESLCKKIKTKTLFNPFYDISGTALTLWVAREELKEGFVFLYSDILFDESIVKGLLANHEDICLAIKKDNIREEAEKVLEIDGVIKRLSKFVSYNNNNESISEFIGIAKFSSRVYKKLIEELNIIAKNNLNSLFIHLINGLIENNERVLIHDVRDARFCDIDFPEDIEKARKIFKL